MMARTEARPEGVERRLHAGPFIGPLSVGGWILLTLAVVALAIGVGSWWTYGRGGQVPPVKGFYAGEEITFVHTEASDPKVADMLTGMMGSPVIVVPELAQVPESAVGDVYVFTNGVKGGGPFGFQADVFDSSPRDAGYSPLRALNLVTWDKDASPRVLRSAEEVRDAETAGRLVIKRPGGVVNMPMVRWPGGRR